MQKPTSSSLACSLVALAAVVASCALTVTGQTEAPTCLGQYGFVCGSCNTQWVSVRNTVY